MTSRYDGIAPRHFITAEDIRTAQARGDAQLPVRENSTITDEARELAMKLGIRLDLLGVSAVNTLPEDVGHKVADAISAVLAELNLGARATTLAPVLTRRVFASLAKVAERR